MNIPGTSKKKKKPLIPILSVAKESKDYVLIFLLSCDVREFLMELNSIKSRKKMFVDEYAYAKMYFSHKYGINFE